MKYNININQFAVSKHGFDLDLIDLAIFDFIRSFILSPVCKIMKTPKGNYYWVSNKLIIDNMPLLGIKTNRGLQNRINKLIDAKLLNRCNDCKKYSLTLYSKGEKFDLLNFENDKEMLTIEETERTTNTPTEQLCYVKEETERKTESNRENEHSNNYNIRDNNNNTLNTITNRNCIKSSTQDQKVLFEDLKKENPKAKKTLFRDSNVYKLLKLDENENIIDATPLLSKFSNEIYKKIDLIYYFFAVADWSDKADKKRTARGWIATIRDFIRRDTANKKVRLKPEYQENTENTREINYEAAMRYLNNDY